MQRSYLLIRIIGISDAERISSPSLHLPREHRSDLPPSTQGPTALLFLSGTSTCLHGDSGAACFLGDCLADKRRPKLAQLPRQNADELYDLAAVDPLRQDIKDRAHADFDLV